MKSFFYLRLKKKFHKEKRIILIYIIEEVENLFIIYYTKLKQIPKFIEGKLLF